MFVYGHFTMGVNMSNPEFSVGTVRFNINWEQRPNGFDFSRAESVTEISDEAFSSSVY